MVGFRDFDGVGIAPVSNKLAVKWGTPKFLGDYSKHLTCYLKFKTVMDFTH